MNARAFPEIYEVPLGQMREEIHELAKNL